MDRVYAAFRESPTCEVRRKPLPRTPLNKGKKKGQGYYTLARSIGREVLPPADQRLGLLGPPGVLLLDVLEELHEILIALSGGVIDVLGVHLTAFGGVVEDARQIEDGVAYAGELLRLRSGHCLESPLSGFLLAHYCFLHLIAYQLGTGPKHTDAAYLHRRRAALHLPATANVLRFLAPPRAPGNPGGLVADPLAFRKAPEPLALYVGVVDEDLRVARVRGDEPVALLLAEPPYRSACQRPAPSRCSSTRLGTYPTDLRRYS
jgi:hypothetical protein